MLSVGCGRAQADSLQSWQDVIACVVDSFNELKIPSEMEQDRAVAQVSGNPITVSDLQADFEKMPSFEKKRYLSAEGKKLLLENHINRIIGAMAAQRNHIKPDQGFFKMLRRERADYMANAYMDHYRQTQPMSSISEDELKFYYTHRTSEFGPHVAVRTSRILSKTRPMAQQAQKLLKTTAFEQVAQRLSTDSSTASQGGWMPAPTIIFGRGETDVEKALVSLKMGAVSDIIASPEGFQLIRKDGQVSIPTAAYLTVKDEIRRRLVNKRMGRWLMSVRSAAGVKIDTDALQAVQLDLQAIPKPTLAQ